MIEFNRVEQTLFQKIIEAVLEGGMSIYLEKDISRSTYNCILGLSNVKGEDGNTIQNAGWKYFTTGN